MFRWIYSLILICTFLALVTTNVLSLTSTAVNGILSGAVATAVGIQTVSAQLQSRLKRQTAVTAKLQDTLRLQKMSVRSMGRNLVARTKRITAYSLAEIPAATVPFAGLALLVGGTAWELNQLCEGLKEMESLYRDMDIDESIEQGTLQAVCHPRSLFGNEEIDSDR